MNLGSLLGGFVSFVMRDDLLRILQWMGNGCKMGVVCIMDRMDVKGGKRGGGGGEGGEKNIPSTPLILGNRPENGGDVGAAASPGLLSYTILNVSNHHGFGSNKVLTSTNSSWGRKIRSTSCLLFSSFAC